MRTRAQGDRTFFVSERGLIASLFALYLAATGVVTLISFRASQIEQLSSTRSTLLTAARAGGHIIGLYFHDIYSRSQAPGELHYRLIVDSLNHLVADLPDVEYVYSMDVIDGNAYFIISNETPEDLQRGTPSLFYNPYQSAPPALFEAHRRRQPIFTPVYTNEWGTFRSAFVPTARSDGSHYIMAADVKIDSPGTLLWRSLSEAALVSLIALLPVYPLLHLYRRLQRRREDELERRLYYDAITGLPDIARLTLDLEPDPAPLSAILINLDDFHAINTLFGYDMGDRLLVQVANTIRRELGDEVPVYRTFVDEFLLLYHEADPDHLQAVTQQLLDSIFSPIETDDQTRITVTARAGIAIGVAQADDLVVIAREAMDEARRCGREYLVYNDRVLPQQRFARNLHWLNEVNSAFRDNRLVPWLQPICDSRSGEIRHYEALARLIGSDGEVYTPWQFLPAIRKSHLYRHLTCAMIEQGLQPFAHKTSSVSINMTRFDLIDAHTIETLISRVEQLGLQGRVIIEVVESESIDYQDEVLRVLQRCKDAGIRIALDDFGSGYANFDQLLKIDADFLKIDGALVRQLPHSARARALVEAIISFAGSLGIPLIAEFVEDETLRRQLQAMGVQYLQGYAIGRPAPVQQFDIL